MKQLSKIHLKVIPKVTRNCQFLKPGSPLGTMLPPETIITPQFGPSSSPKEIPLDPNEDPEGQQETHLEAPGLLKQSQNHLKIPLGGILETDGAHIEQTPLFTMFLMGP